VTNGILRVDANKVRTDSSEDEVRTGVGSNPDAQSWGFVSEHMPRHVPLFIPSDQAYYWGRGWQESVRKTYADLEAGEYVDFDDPNDPDAVVRWLLSDEEDE